MRIENIGPDDIQVGDFITYTDVNADAVVTHVLEPGWVVVLWDTQRSVYGWVDDAWRLDGLAVFHACSAYRDGPDKWARRQGNFVAPRDGDWAFVVDYHRDMRVNNDVHQWAHEIAAQTAQWLTDRLNEGHFGEMPTGDGEAV